MVHLLALLLPALSGCGSSTPPPPPVLELMVRGGADQNPEADGKPRPVAVHLYQLAATQAFTKADVFALVEHERATLGADDLASSDLVLAPSEQQQLKQELKPGTRFLGVIVWFRDIDHAQWRAVPQWRHTG